MTDLWNIITSDGAELGPMTPLEIRDALREGRVDPFDQVYRSGSKVVQVLVEVDEIFAAAEAASRKSDSIYDEPEDGAAGEPSNHKTTLVAKKSNKTPNHKTIKSQRIVQHKNTPNKRADKPRPQRDKKRFHVTNKRGQSLGPLSAAEVQSLFYRGVLSKNVKVQKDHGSKKIPIQQFIGAYVGAKAKHFKSEHTKMGLGAKGQKWRYPNSRVMEQLRRTAIHNIKTGRTNPFIIAATIALTIVLGYFIANRFLIKNQNSRVHRKSETVVIDIQKKIEKPPETPKIKKKTAPASKVKKKSGNKAVSSKKLKKAKRSYPKPRYKHSLNRPRKQTTYRSSYSSPSKTVRPKRQLAARTPPANPYESQLGNIITISPAKYNPTALAKCQLKCQLTFRDKANRSITAVFFKAQYDKALKTKNGVAVITGRLGKKSGQYRIYLQGVR